TARRPVEQRRAQLLLQLQHPPRDGGLRGVQLGGSLRKAPQARYPIHRLELLVRPHGAPLCGLTLFICVIGIHTDQKLSLFFIRRPFHNFLPRPDVEGVRKKTVLSASPFTILPAAAPAPAALI